MLGKGKKKMTGLPKPFASRLVVAGSCGDDASRGMTVGKEFTVPVTVLSCPSLGVRLSVRYTVVCLAFRPLDFAFSHVERTFSTRFSFAPLCSVFFHCFLLGSHKLLSLLDFNTSFP
jgi:hypothetical protein